MFRRNRLTSNKLWKIDRYYFIFSNKTFTRESYFIKYDSTYLLLRIIIVSRHIFFFFCRYYILPQTKLFNINVHFLFIKTTQYTENNKSVALYTVYLKRSFYYSFNLIWNFVSYLSRI